MDAVNNLLHTEYNAVMSLEAKELIIPGVILAGCHLFMLLLFWARLNMLGCGSFGVMPDAIGYALHGAAQIVSCFAIWHIYNACGSFIIAGVCLCANILRLCFFVKLCI